MGSSLIAGRRGLPLPLPCARYVLNYVDRHLDVNRFFKLTWGADEVLFQTILANSPFRGLLIDRDLRYIDWSEEGPSPKVLTLNDAPALHATEALWAHKFRADDSVLDYLDELRQGS